jgi:hypothetical protein
MYNNPNKNSLEEFNHRMKMTEKRFSVFGDRLMEINPI